MPTFLAGGTGTPKLLHGAAATFPPAETPVVANTGDDIELAGHLICPDLDTQLFADAGELDTETWWGIAEETTTTHDALHEFAERAGFDTTPRYLDADAQTSGRRLARWRRFSGVGEFMHIGDRDRAVHLTRTGRIDEGDTLTEATAVLRDALGVERTILPMSDDPVATIIRTPGGEQHFQEWWVANGGEPTVEEVTFRGAGRAEPTPEVLDRLTDPVVIGPSNPVTSLGPMLAMDAFRDALESTPVVVVSPFVGSEVFSGPAGKLMAATGHEPSTAGTAALYDFADAFVLDSEDETNLARPTVRTDTTLDTPEDSARVARAVERALGEVG
ncbi:2-phospho-L-lactate transferase [Halobacteriales archaeon QH_7_65_31]|nr:MAG: 2-phospho-L-lactate transferase [Halobacteriales archaeon QH_7_65_31]